jgi:hypothetical protein
VSFRGISIDSKLKEEANEDKLVLREERPRRADKESSASLSLLRLEQQMSRRCPNLHDERMTSYTFDEIWLLCW